jgi:ubiquinone/menaquinone biosynthesis C-methylase UbiE
MPEHQYAGHALTPEAEARRLVRQAEAHADGTRWLFQQAGLQPGMRVLDVGSGIGAVATIAAEFVGPAGHVVGVDTNAGVLAVARARALEAGLTNVSFVDADLHSADVGGGFDAVVGRSVLMHVADPVAALRSLSQHLISGGIVAFREVDAVSPWTSIPANQLLQEFSLFWVSLVHSMGVHPTMGSDLYRTFVEAGLPPPRMHKDAAIGGGPDWVGYDYLSENSSAAKVVALKVGLDWRAEFEGPRLVDHLRQAVAAQNGVLCFQNSVNAWTRLEADRA